MKEEDAERLLDDLRILEPLLDNNAGGISGGKKVLAAALLRGLGGAKMTEPRLITSIEALCFAVRGCYEGSGQYRMLVEVLKQCGITGTNEPAMMVLWTRAHQALAELKEDMEQVRRRSS